MRTIAISRDTDRVRGGGLILAGSVVLFASAWPLTKLALVHGTSPLWFALGRSALSGIMATAMLAARGGLVLPRRADIASMCSIGGLQLAGYFALAHAALAWVPAGRTSILANTTTMWVVPLSVLILRERVPPRRWLACVLALAGVAVLASPWSIDWRSAPVLIGHGFLLGAGLAWSVSMIITRAAPPVLTMFELLPWAFALSSLLLFALILIEEPHGSFGADWASWSALLYVGAVAGPLGTWCVVEATARLPIAVSSVGFLATPATTLVLSNLMLHEPITLDLILGFLLIMAGVGFAAFSRERR